MTSTGDLAGTLAALRDASGSAIVVGSVALVLLVVLGAVTVTQVARLVAQTRAGETAILVARGASRGSLAVLTWGEAAVVAVVGTGAGTAVGLALGGALPAPGAVVVLAAVVLWTLAIGLPGWSSTRSLTRGVRIDVSGRSRTLATGGAAVLLLLAAGGSLWRFSRDDPARTPLDQALAIGAPGLVTLALAVVVLVLLTPVWSLLERAAAGRVGTAPRLALLSVSRRRSVLGVPLLLVVVAVATSVLGAGYTASTQAAQDRLDGTRVGADARLELPARSAVTPLFPPRTTAAVEAVDGVTAAALVARVPARTGQQDLVLEAVAAPAVEAVVRGGTVSPARVSAALAPTSRPPAVPEGTVSVAVLPAQGAGTFDGDITTLSATGTLWLTSPVGELARVELAGGDLALGATGTLVGDVPPGDWRLLAVDVVADGTTSGWENTLELTVQEVTVDGAPVATGADAWATAAWPVASGAGTGAAGTNPSDGATAAARFQGSATLRFVPDPVGPVPAVVTRALADRLDLATGDGLTVSYRGGTVEVTIGAVTDLVPGVLDEPAAVVDLTALQRGEALVRRSVADASEIWVALEPGAAGTAAVTELRALARGESATLVTTESARAGTAVAQPVFAAVGLVAVVLAVVGALAAFDVLTRTRRGEVVALRAVGVPGRVQGRSRLVEALVLGAVAVPAGVAVGWAVASLTIGTLVRLSVPGLAGLSQPLALAPLELALGLALALGGVAAVGALVSRRVRRQHRDTDHREETR
ncbi:FtsX-like permease family protein [Serinibacter arcticus]|uniref:FtsX-like permease family protein n=1 Tax=Serinibacter arcticus TaxID=1655435 RepID=UPI002E27613A